MDSVLEGIPYGRRLTDLARDLGERTALIFAADDDTESEYSWAELDTRANQMARRLDAEGVSPDDVVAIGLHNGPGHVFSTFAAWKLGASVLPLRPALPGWERDRLLAVALPRVLIGDWPDAPPGTLSTKDIEATSELDDSPFGGTHVPEYSRLVASSGSTGTPKIIASPSPALYVADSDEPATMLMEDNGVVMTASPLYHTNGFSFCYPPLLEGRQVVLMERFEAARAVRLIEKYRVSMTVLVPTMLQRVAQLEGVGERDFSSIERIVYGGAVVPEWAVRAWLELIPPERFYLTYGGSEQLGMCAATGADWLTHPGTTGRPVDCEIVILDAEHQPLPTGEVGEIWLRHLTKSEPFRYLGAPTPDAILNGYRSLGDMGWVDGDGFLYIADRRNDMIVTGGVNVFPAEVEMALSEHPQVLDVVVIGLPDPEWGRRVRAVIEPRDPLAPPSAEDLRSFCKRRLSGPKVPKEFEIVDHLPRTAAGKINRSRLAEERAAI